MGNWTKYWDLAVFHILHLAHLTWLICNTTYLAMIDEERQNLHVKEGKFFHWKKINTIFSAPYHWSQVLIKMPANIPCTNLDNVQGLGVAVYCTFRQFNKIGLSTAALTTTNRWNLLIWTRIFFIEKYSNIKFSELFLPHFTIFSGVEKFLELEMIGKTGPLGCHLANLCGFGRVSASPKFVNSRLTAFPAD